MKSEGFITILCAIIILAYFIKMQIAENDDYKNYSMMRKIAFVFFNGLMIIVFGILFILAFTLIPYWMFSLVGGGM